jgi:hypothetical protein
MTTATAQLTDGQHARQFALAGNARLTLVSVKTGTRFTFRVQRGKQDAAPHFVSLLNGSNNEDDYVFLGTIFGDNAYRHGRKSRVSAEAPSAKGWAWAWAFLARGELPPACEVWHEGRCGRCGRTLTVPESLRTGLGPECAQKGSL